jgi:hypothetical protein
MYTLLTALQAGATKLNPSWHDENGAASGSSARESNPSNKIALSMASSQAKPFHPRPSKFEPLGTRALPLAMCDAPALANFIYVNTDSPARRANFNASPGEPTMKPLSEQLAELSRRARNVEDAFAQAESEAVAAIFDAACLGGDAMPQLLTISAIIIRMSVSSSRSNTDAVLKGLPHVPQARHNSVLHAWRL